MEEQTKLEIFLKWIDGKKTHLCAIALGINNVLYANGVIDVMTKDLINIIFGTGTIMAIRSGLNKVGK